MDLTQITYNISLAKSDNAKWLAFADVLIQGNTVSKEGIPVHLDKCIPCQWLYDHSDEVSRLYQTLDKTEVDLFHFDIMEQIEVLRYDLHESYLQIFRIFLPEMNNSFFANLFKSKRAVTDYDRVKAKRQYLKMKKVKEELDIKLNFLERSVHQLCKLNIA